MSYLLLHGASVYIGHLRGSVTLTPIAERLPVELSLPVFNDIGLSRLGFEHTVSACKCHLGTKIGRQTCYI